MNQVMSKFITILKGMVPAIIVEKARRQREEERDKKSRALFYERLIGKDVLVFDVGANVGNRVAAFLSHSRQVVAIEPQPSCGVVLERKFSANDKFVLVKKALGPSSGEIELRWSTENDVLASVSRSFIEYAENSERFDGGGGWKNVCKVEVVTLDSLISNFGVPDFIKLDTEGFEAEILMGLSKAPGCLSFEFTPDFHESALACLSRCNDIGMTQFNISYGESMRLARAEWLSLSEMERVIDALKGDTWLFGDVYARRSVPQAPYM
jgi:FkbM family methyltransferase